MEADNNAEQKKGRGNGEFRSAKFKAQQNFLFMWGCRPSDQVDAKTAMVKDVVKTLMKKYNRNDMTIHIPSAFEHLKGSDANFEMVTSNTI